MEVTSGIWKVSDGKGDRVYIQCLDETKISHPEQITTSNGMLVYGFEHVQHLAIAIIRFEKLKDQQESILSKV